MARMASQGVPRNPPVSVQPAALVLQTSVTTLGFYRHAGTWWQRVKEAAEGETALGENRSVSISPALELKAHMSPNLAFLSFVFKCGFWGLNSGLLSRA